MPEELRDYVGHNESAIFTRLNINVVETICGSPDLLLEAWMYGGMLPTGEKVSGEWIPNLKIGSEYVAILTDFTGELILAAGEFDILYPRNGKFSGPLASDLAIDELKAVCP